MDDGRSAVWVHPGSVKIELVAGVPHIMSMVYLTQTNRERWGERWQNTVKQKLTSDPTNMSGGNRCTAATTVTTSMTVTIFASYLIISCFCNVIRGMLRYKVQIKHPPCFEVQGSVLDFIFTAHLVALDTALYL
jgi:hypothetical protein